MIKLSPGTGNPPPKGMIALNCFWVSSTSRAKASNRITRRPASRELIMRKVSPVGLTPLRLPFTSRTMTSTCITPVQPIPFSQAAGAFRRYFVGVLPLRVVRGALITVWLVLAASAVVYADEHLQDWIPGVLTIPDDAEVVKDRAIGSTMRIFSIATGADVDALFADWEESLSGNGYPVTQGADDLLDRSIEFSGPGIVNAKIIVAPSSEDGRSIVEFDATLD